MDHDDDDDDDDDDGDDDDDDDDDDGGQQISVHNCLGNNVYSVVVCFLRNGYFKCSTF